MHFGVLVVLNMMIGLIHPPFGMLLFVTKALTGIPIGEMMKEGWPFLVMLLLLLLALTLYPPLVLWLPHFLATRLPDATDVSAAGTLDSGDAALARIAGTGQGVRKPTGSLDSRLAQSR